MRSVDRPTPTIDTHRPAVEPWPAVLHIGVQRVPTAVYVWDDFTAVWDDTDAAFVWDDVEAWAFDRQEMFCRFHGLTIIAGNPDAAGMFESAALTMTLDNRDGELSIYDEAGRLVDWMPGGAVDVWADYAGEAFWLFSGVITVWQESLDGTVDVEAFDRFTTLNQFQATWTPGTAGQTPGQRLAAICTRVGFDGPTRFAPGDVTLLTKETDDSALEQMQLTALSDGGILFCDADGTVVYADREWIAGRPDQEAIPVLTDNVCDTPGAVVVWDPIQTTSDEPIINYVIAANIDTPPQTATAINELSVSRHGPQSWPGSRTDDLWSTQLQGQTLVDWIVAHRSAYALALESVSLYLHDRRFDYWATALDVRLGDLVDWVHDQTATTGIARFDIIAAVTTITHDITPESWITSIGTTPALDYRRYSLWDATEYDWDDGLPDNVWR